MGRTVNYLTFVPWAREWTESARLYTIGTGLACDCEQP
jgi:hypothetical protein